MANHLKHLKAQVEKELKDIENDWAKNAELVDLAKQNKIPPQLVKLLGYTEQVFLMKGLSRSIHRIFVQTTDSGEYFKLGWVLHSDSHFCMVCTKSFALTTNTSVLSIFDWSHHEPVKINCHACGNVVCEDCVEQSVVCEIRSVGPVPVCKQCSFGQVIFALLWCLL